MVVLRLVDYHLSGNARSSGVGAETAEHPAQDRTQDAQDAPASTKQSRERIKKVTSREDPHTGVRYLVLLQTDEFIQTGLSA